MYMLIHFILCIKDFLATNSNIILCDSSFTKRNVSNYYKYCILKYQFFYNI